VKSLDPVFERLGQNRLVAVLMIDEVDHAVPLARALLAGGVGAMELTLRTEAALPALERVAAEVPEMLVGAGTVLRADQVSSVVKAGAAFGVAPGTNETVLRAAREVGLPFAPGIATASEIETALEHDCRVLKVFPVGPLGGLPYLDILSSPYRHLGLRYIPLGGVDEGNFHDYAAVPEVLAVGGSWLAPPSQVAARDWDGIEARAAMAAEVVAGARSQR